MRKVYVVQTRANGRSRRVTLGCHGDIAPGQVRKVDAAKIIVRLKAGLQPVEQESESEPAVADLAVRYEREQVVVHCKSDSITYYGLAPALPWTVNSR